MGSVVSTSRERVDPSKLGEESLIHYSIPVLDETDEPLIEPANGIGSQKFRVMTDAVLVSLLNPRIPRVWLAHGGPTAVCSTEFAVLRPNTSALSLDYLHLWCRSAGFWEQLQLKAVGTTGSRQRAKAEGLAEIEMPLPSLPEQRRIVHLIGALDTDLNSLASESLIVEVMLTQQRQGLDLSSDVPLEGILVGIDSGKSVLTGGDAPVDGLPRILKISAVRPARFAASEAKALDGSVVMPSTAKVREGDLLITRSNTPDRVGYCARARHVPEGTHMPDLIWRLRLDEGVCDPDYFEQAMASPQMRNRVTSTASGTSASMRKINKKGILTVRLPLPRLDEQRAYAEACLSIASLRSALDEEARTLRALRSRLIEDLLTGAVSVPDSYDSLIGQAV